MTYIKLTKEVIRFTETSIQSYQTTWRHTSECSDFCVSRRGIFCHESKWAM